jgi:hypothetical protein
LCVGTTNTMTDSEWWIIDGTRSLDGFLRAGFLFGAVSP